MKSSYYKVGNINPSEPIIQKLNIMDYVFFYKGVDLTDATLEYFFDEIETVELEFDDGKKISEEKGMSPTINFSIYAKDENKKDYSFDFIINMDVDTLNKLSDEPININKYIIQGEIFFKDPYSKTADFLDLSLEENIHDFTPSYWVQKLDDKKFAFKIQYQNLLIWFHVKF